MKRHIISRDIREFVRTHVTSVAMLEALLLLHKTPDAAWTIPELARRLYLAPHIAAQVIDRLYDEGFCRPAGLDAYRYDAGSAGLSLLVERIAATYETNLIGLTNLIHDRLRAEAGWARQEKLFRRREDDTRRYC